MIKDSGNRREYETGAVRDIQKGKGITIVEPSVTVKGCLKTTDIPALEALADAILA